MKKLLAVFFIPFALSNCSDPCNGHIETSVLYFKQALQGQLVYANVLNNPSLGSQQTLTRDDKEYGTFPHVIIINDPEMKYKGRGTICFDEFTKQALPADIDLRERDIPRILITK
ncbi:hypothetical protein E4631_16480 [Hymenobacter sp. UV11]|uniref:hypothetical protein n=1 Tax=Hymenobacter sp. UV11 TaxID=1849735 RepID=UPI00105F66E7|nr:hypothetical protein [Hymenobacter sp. UV11]TDN37923.1 hypothetical protein A8B98_01310 [Hymenobacter sp. UV11]TFZ65135.1 hypothetical protein E4631_16480 [Hymenobacter sp. UV11]